MNLQGKVEVVTVTVEVNMEVLPQKEAETVHTKSDAVDDEEVSCQMRRSLLLPQRFREDLLGPNNCFLESMQDLHTVTVLGDTARGKLHIKGAKDNVIKCYTQLKTLLKELRRREDNLV